PMNLHRAFIRHVSTDKTSIGPSPTVRQPCFRTGILPRPGAGQQHKKTAGKRLPAVLSRFPARTDASISEDAHHRAVALLLGEQPRIILVIALVPVDDDMLGGRYEAVLDTSEAAERLLVCSRVEETDILRFAGRQLRQEHGVGMGLAAVIVFAVA